MTPELLSGIVSAVSSIIVSSIVAWFAYKGQAKQAEATRQEAEEQRKDERQKDRDEAMKAPAEAADLISTAAGKTIDSMRMAYDRQIKDLEDDLKHWKKYAMCLYKQLKEAHITPISIDDVIK